MQKTAENLKTVEALLYAMVPMIISFVFFGFYRMGLMMDMGQKGHQMGSQAGMTTLFAATRFRGGGGGGDPPPKN